MLQGDATLAGSAIDGSLPAELRAHLRLEAEVRERWSLRVSAKPRLAAANLASAGDPGSVVMHGVSDAFVHRRGETWDVSIGLQRWTLGEGRLLTAVARDAGRVAGHPRGVWGVRTTGYPGAWRARVGLTAEAGPSDATHNVMPGAVGAAAALRYDGADATVSVHLHGVASPEVVAAAGATGSTTLASWVSYGELWWIAPSGVRTLVGSSGYLGRVLATLEAGWLASDPTLTRAEPNDGRPTVQVEASLPRQRATWTVQLGAAWPELAGDAVPVTDAALRWTRPAGDTDVTVVGSMNRSMNATRFGATVAWTAYF